MYIAILGRQPALSLAELERVYGNVARFSETTARIKTDQPVSIERLGGTQKAGRVILELPSASWPKVSNAIIAHYTTALKSHEGKITLGISAYDGLVTGREVQKIGLTLKSRLKQYKVSVRLIPNQESILSTATSHHNKLGLSENKIELIIVQGTTSTIIAESTGAQNITALSARDQGRPKRDAFVGMLPPKLAQIMINLATEGKNDSSQRILDPFCGTGVLLQEALLLGSTVYGTDLSEKMVQYSEQNLAWLQQKYHSISSWELAVGDAMETSWQKPITAVVAETYLGQPFSAPPSPKKLVEVRGNCQHIISTFLKNLHPQLAPGTPVCLAVPAWRGADESITHLPLVNQLASLGYEPVTFTTVSQQDLLYFRPDQVVARELLVMTRK